MKIIMDRNIQAAGELFDALGDVERLDGRQIGPEHVHDADALIVRSVTPVGEALLKGSTVRFVGTTTIGTDHLDTQWLEDNAIQWASAPGCNADAAAQYTLALIFLACQRLALDPARLRYGIIGLGNVGSRVKSMLQHLGAPVIANDPPLQERGDHGLVDLNEALQADVVCLHTPLSHDGPYPTFRLINRQILAAMNDGALLVNTSRGGVVDGAELGAELRSGRLRAALDVWPTEPGVDPDLLRHSTVATPHVAGYSEDGKLNGALMIHRAFCDWSGLKPGPESTPGHVTEGGADGLSIDLRSGTGHLATVLDRCCFVAFHDDAMRRLITKSATGRARAFDRLRREYPYRRDFKAWSICGADLELSTLCRNLGFSIEPSGT